MSSVLELLPSICDRINYKTTCAARLATEFGYDLTAEAPVRWMSLQNCAETYTMPAVIEYLNTLIAQRYYTRNNKFSYLDILKSDLLKCTDAKPMMSVHNNDAFVA